MKLLGDRLWTQLRALAKRKGKKMAAVAYVSSDEYVKFGGGDTLVVDASDEAIKAGQTSVSVLHAAHKRGARLFSYPGLHAKVYSFDRVVVVGSANLSASSASELFEAALVTEGARAVAAVHSLFEALEKDAKRIDEPFLERAAKLPVRKAWKGHGTKRTAGPRIRESRVWITCVAAVEEDEYPDEVARVQAGRQKVIEEYDLDEDEVSWIRFTGTSRFKSEARPGDTVIQLWRTKHSDRRAWVYRPVPILRRQTEPTCVRYYVQEFADGEKTAVSLSTFAKLWKAAGVSKSLPKHPIREVQPEKANRLLALWESE